MQKGMGALLGLGDDETLMLVYELEKVCKAHGLARRQVALASALWRTVSSHPSYAGQADFDMVRIVLEEGGRLLRVEVRVFPPAGPPPRPETLAKLEGTQSPGGSSEAKP